MTFIFRKPTVADGEMHAKTMQKSVPVANLNLIQSVIVHPDPAPIIGEIEDYPLASSQFVQEVLSPFFGDKITARGKKI